MTPVQVNDILHQWTKTKDLEQLKELDKRFIEANVLGKFRFWLKLAEYALKYYFAGKIANIIRQSQQRCSTRRPLAEFILIPQYYPSGYFSLIKK